jgi:DNA-binding transcriptional MerR regulator/methylmalonyl-CoA mutase cobalamin-binding subunit
MNIFTISQLQQYSGIKAHTIRIWEQRYNALSPNRSEGNTRYYDNNQLRRLLNIVSLMESEYKVSELCSMTDQELFRKLDKELQNRQPKDDTAEYYIAQLIAAGMCFDEPHFDKIFSNCLLRFGLKDCYIKVLYPMLSRIGLMWAKDQIPPAQEHFVSNIVRLKLSSAIDSLPPPKSSKSTWLLFLPENEFHEIGLLFSNYLIRQSGKKVIYLGSNVPNDALIDTIKETAPAHLLFFLVHHDHVENVQDYINNLKKNLGKTKIHLSGNEKLIKQLELGKDIHWMCSVEELEKQLV